MMRPVLAGARPRELVRSLSSAPPRSLTELHLAAEGDVASRQRAARDALESGDLELALAAATACLDAARAHFGKLHPAVASALNNVAQVHRARGELTEALAPASDAVDLYEKLCGPAHPSTATAQGNLGLISLAAATRRTGLERVSGVDAARVLLEKALETRKAAFGPDHAQTALGMVHLASASRAARSFIQAEKLLVDAIALLRRTAGDTHPLTATALNNHGLVLKDRGLLQRAAAAYAESWALRHTALGPRHPDTIAVQHNLAECRRAAGDEEGAVALQRDILRALGRDAPDDSPVSMGAVAASAHGGDEATKR